MSAAHASPYTGPNTSTQDNAAFPRTPEARHQAGGAKPQQLIAFVHLPLPLRCAVEMFLASGERTHARLLGLIDHFLTVYGLAACDERQLFTDSAVAHVKARTGLGATVGF